MAAEVDIGKISVALTTEEIESVQPIKIKVMARVLGNDKMALPILENLSAKKVCKAINPPPTKKEIISFKIKILSIALFFPLNHINSCANQNKSDY